MTTPNRQEDGGGAAGVTPPFERGSWQHAVDDFLVDYGRTSQSFATPHDAVRWLVKVTGDAALACRGINTNGVRVDEQVPDGCYAASNGEGKCAHFCGAARCNAGVMEATNAD